MHTIRAAAYVIIITYNLCSFCGVLPCLLLLSLLLLWLQAGEPSAFYSFNLLARFALHATTLTYKIQI